MGSMNWCSNCRLKAVARGYLPLFKCKCIRRRVYATWDESREEVFNYIDMLYSSVRRYNNNLSSVNYETQYLGVSPASR